MFGKGGAPLPLRFRSMTSEWVPEWMTSIGGDYAGQPSRTVTGITFSNDNIRDRLAYWCYDSHPYDEMGLLSGASYYATQVAVDRCST